MPVRRKFHWTPEEENQLRELASRRMTVQQIALRLRRGPKPVKIRAKMLGLVLREQTRLTATELGSIWKQR